MVETVLDWHPFEYFTVEQVTGPRRVREIARMLGGVELTQKTRDHAREMRRSLHGRSGGAPSDPRRSGRRGGDDQAEEAEKQCLEGQFADADPL